MERVVGTVFGSYGVRPTRLSSRGESTDRPRSTRAVQCGLGVVVLWAKAGRAPSHAVGEGSTAPTPRQVGDTGFSRLWSPRSNPVARSPRAFRPVENQPTAYGARALASADLAWLCFGPTWGALLPTLSAGARPHKHRERSSRRSSKPVARALESRVKRPARISHRGVSADRPRSMRRALQIWRVVVLWPNAGGAPPHAVGGGSTA